MEQPASWICDEAIGLGLPILAMKKKSQQSSYCRECLSLLCLVAFTAMLMGTALPAHAVKIKDLTDLQNAEDNTLVGFGLIVGLAGTGDSAGSAARAQRLLLNRLGFDITDPGELSSNNVAVVTLTAVLPPFLKKGTKIDVLVSSLFDADSLEGGTLMQAHLFGPAGPPPDGPVYAVAQGPITVGGFLAEGPGAQIRANHVVAGRIPDGATLVRDVPATITDGISVNLNLRRPDFTTAARIVEGLNQKFADNISVALTAGRINVTIPETFKSNLVGFIAQLEDVDVQPGRFAQVIINERTGTVVAGGNVQILPVAISQGGLTVSIKARPLVFMPAPFTDSDAVLAEDTVAEAQNIIGRMVPIQGATVWEIADALNQLQVPTRDMISIFSALHAAGALQGKLVIM